MKKEDTEPLYETKKDINTLNFLQNSVSNIGKHIAIKMRLFPNNSLYRQIDEFEMKRNKGALSTEEVQSMVEYQHYVDSDHKSYADRMISEIEHLDREKATIYQKGALLLYDVLKSDPNIRRVVNVGARVDIVSSCLAKKFPLVDFISVDFNENLDEINSVLPQSNNWFFEKGYALELFKEKRVVPDVVLFSSTSVLINQRELEEYVGSFSDSAKYIIFNEPWWTPVNRFLSYVPVPEEIGGSWYGGCFRQGYVNYLHNYHKILSDCGYNVVLSLIVSNEHWHCPCYCLQIIGKRNKNNLNERHEEMPMSQRKY